MKPLIAIFALTTVLTAALFTMPHTANAATSEVTWTNPDKYTDIRSGDESRKHFRGRVFNSVEKHLAKLAKKLPNEQVVKIEFTNVDLAGDTHFGGISRIRVIKDIYAPRLTFNYKLVNEDGTIDSEGEASLRDMAFMMRSRLKYRHKSFGYERQMLDEWFFETFATKLVATD